MTRTAKIPPLVRKDARGRWVGHTDFISLPHAIEAARQAYERFSAEADTADVVLTDARLATLAGHPVLVVTASNAIRSWSQVVAHLTPVTAPAWIKVRRDRRDRTRVRDVKRGPMTTVWRVVLDPAALSNALERSSARD